MPAIAIFNSATEILQNDVVAMSGIIVSQFGTADISLKNTGLAPLVIESDEIAFNGVDAPAFSLDSQPANTIQPGSESVFRIRYSPSIIGTQSAFITIPNNDPLRNPARFTVQGEGRFPAPSSITANSDSSDSITINWSATTGADYYNVYRSNSSGGVYTSVGTNLTTSYTNTSLSAGATYYYKVSAHSAYGESSQSSFESATTRPAAPAGASAVALSDSSIQITWNGVSGANNYTVYRAVSSDSAYIATGSSSTTSYTDTGLSTNTGYYYKISAHGDGGESAQSAYISTTTQIAVPTGVSATVLSASSIQVMWNAVNGAVSYTVYRSSSSDGVYTSVSISSSTSYTDASLTGGAIYYYKVSATGPNGEGDQSAYISTGTLPITPTGVSATALSASSIQITWNAVSGASSYILYRSDSSDGVYTFLGSSSTALYADTGLNSSTTYYYKVEAINAIGTSDQSAYVSATTQTAPILYPPSELGAFPVSTGIRIFWNAVTDASGYTVYRAASVNGAYTSIATNLTATTYLDSVSGNTVYYYKVATINSDGIAGSQSSYNYSPGPGTLTLVPYNSTYSMYNIYTIATNTEKYYRLYASGNSYMTIRWADAGDGGPDFVPALKGDVIVTACLEDTGEIIFLNHENGYSTYTTFYTGGSNVILQVVARTAGSFGLRYDY
jgi:fibronectin type 3 domain-containing protein